ncbi:MAG: aldehyde dehydrogenase family protein, partial [Anaerolineaceae bacterium]
MTLIQQQLFIDGKWVPADSGEMFEVINPVDAKPMGMAAKAGRAEAKRALEAANKAFKTWGKSTPDERSKALKKAAAAVSARQEELAKILCMEHGKPLGDARKEIKGAIDTLEYYA